MLFAICIVMGLGSIAVARAMKGFSSFTNWSVLLPAVVVALIGFLYGWHKTFLATYEDWDQAKLVWAAGIAGYVIGCLWQATADKAERDQATESEPHTVRDPIAFLQQYPSSQIRFDPPIGRRQDELFDDEPHPPMRFVSRA